MYGTFEYDVFISYSSKDKDTVCAIARRLQHDGLRVWLDEWEIKSGDSISFKVEQGLTQSRALLICMSPAYFGSEWETMEHQTLIFRDPLNKQRRLILLFIEDCARPDIIAKFPYIHWMKQSDKTYKQLLDACRKEAAEKERHEIVEENALPKPIILKGHKKSINCVAITPDGKTIVSGSRDKTMMLWDSETRRSKAKLEYYYDRRPWNYAFLDVAIASDGKTIVSGSRDKTVRIWDIAAVKPTIRCVGHTDSVFSVAITPDGKTVVSGSADNDLRVWELKTARSKKPFEGHTGSVFSVAITPNGKTVVSGSEDRTLRIWDIETSRCKATLEGHTDAVRGIAITSDGETVVSGSEDRTLKIWKLKTGECKATLEGHTSPILDVAITPNGKTIISGLDDGTLWIWNLDPNALPDLSSEPGVHYVNAKIVLVGDTGVGKTGLCLVLNNQPFMPTESTPGRRVWVLQSQNIKISDEITQTRETLLWDLAGQPGYRIIHQLHLNEVAIALVVFDARSEIDPFAGVRYWERALRLAQQRQRSSRVPMKKFLVSARADRSKLSVSKERLKVFMNEFGFDDYFETSAKEGWKIKELREAIEQGIQWEYLQDISSSRLFADIKSFLLDVKKTGRFLALASDLHSEMVQSSLKASKHYSSIVSYFRKQLGQPNINVRQEILRDQFDTCIGRLENQDLIRRLSFGGYVLLQPELLDAYASAIIIKAKDEPDGLGSLAEEDALAGNFFVPEEQKIIDQSQEQLLLHATVEELVIHDLALRENSDDGRYLVFPSQFNRDYENAPDPQGKAVDITFNGPVLGIYATLAVRLGHSGLFTVGRAEMYHNAAVFTAKAGGKCGLLLKEFAEVRGRLTLFFDENVSIETRYHFEEFVITHVKRRALDGYAELVRFFVCSNCCEPVPKGYVKRLIENGKRTFDCPCGGMVSLEEPKDRIRFKSEVEAMDKSADLQRSFNAFVMSAKGETSTKSFKDWAGDERITLAIVFTDVISSTSLGIELKDETMNKVRRAYFTQSRKLIDRFNGREIKTLGDGFMTAFKSAEAALDYAMAIQSNTGHSRIKIRAGIHIGPMQVEENDVFGDTVNFAARVVGAFSGEEIWLSDRAKGDIDRFGAARHKQLKWEQHIGVIMKGFPEAFTLWSITNPTSKAPGGGNKQA